MMAIDALTEKQHNFLRDLVEARVGRPLNDDELRRLAMLTKKEAADTIGREIIRRDERKKIAPAPVQSEPDAPVPPPGFYAVEREGVLKFYRLRDGKNRWDGFRFVDVQASDEFHPIRNRSEKAAIQAAILAAGTVESARRYGTEIGSCGVCGRTLTDATSRDFGIGPICREKWGV